MTEASYDLFISYNRNPDYRCARDLTRFLERFHKTPTGKREISLRELEICLDGVTFSNPPATERTPAGGSKAVDAVLVNYLKHSKELLVLCSSRARSSEWVGLELEWWLENRGPDSVRVAVTEDVGDAPDRFFPEAIVSARIHERIYYDFRSFHGSKDPGATDYDSERVRLACDLNGQSASDVYPLWFADQLRKARARALRIAAGAAVILIAIGIAIYFGVRKQMADRHAVEQGAARLVADSFEVLQRDPASALLLGWNAEQTHPTDRARAAIGAAYRVLTFRLTNRRENLQITGSGPGYLAGRFKEGGHFNVMSGDGRHTIYVTERGESGSNPPGNVYLGDAETLRVIELRRDDRKHTQRVEFAGFDRAQKHVFVARQFDFEAYEFDGSHIAEFGFSRFTKSPIHHIGGYLANRFVLGGDGKGGLWLVDPHTGQSHTIQREWHGDPILDSQIAPSGLRACLVFESGRANILQLLDPGERHVTIPLVDHGALFAGFAGDDEDRVLIAGRNGKLQVWRIGGRAATVEKSFEGLEGDLDWAWLSLDGNRLVAVSRNHLTTLLDFPSGEILERFDDSDEIDWAAMRRMPRQWQPPTGTRLQAGCREWLSTKKGAFAIQDDRFLQMTPSFHPTLSIVDAGGSTWIRTGTTGMMGSLGPTYRVEGQGVEPTPEHVGEINAICESSSAAYLASTTGAWRFRQGRYEHVEGIEHSVGTLRTTDDAVWALSNGKAHRIRGLDAREFPDTEDSVVGIHVRDRDVWLTTGTAGPLGALLTAGPAFLVRGDSSQAVPESARPIREIHFAGDDVWLLSGKPSGPAYRWTAKDVRAVPDEQAKITDLFAVGASVWLVDKKEDGAPEALLVEPDGVRRFPIESGWVEKIVERAGRTWVLTLEGAFVREGDRLRRLTDSRVNVTALDDTAWLFGKGGAHRFDDRGLVFYPTGEHTVDSVREVRGEVWLLTRVEYLTPGPAYRVERDRAIEYGGGTVTVRSIEEQADGSVVLQAVEAGRPKEITLPAEPGAVEASGESRRDR